MTSKYYLGDLEEKYLAIVEDIYHKGNSEGLTGKQAKEFFEKLLKSAGKVHEDAVELQERYREEAQWVVEKMRRLKLRYYDCFVTHRATPVLRLEGKLAVSSFPRSAFMASLEGHSLLGSLTFEQKEFVRYSLGSPKELQLLFRASEHDFSAAAFHARCDGTPDTLTLLRTEHGRTLAAYSHYQWNQVSNDYVNDKERRAWLLQLDLLQKMVPQSDSSLIYCNSSYGPTFGGGHDLYIADSCHANNSYTDFPGSYNREDGSKYTRGQESYTAFTGATGGYFFKVREYEVFRVVYN
jgi:hypothetical protein